MSTSHKNTSKTSSKHPRVVPSSNNVPNQHNPPVQQQIGVTFSSPEQEARYHCLGDYLCIHSRNRQLLTLTYPLTGMEWCLESNLGVAMPRANLELDVDEPIPNAPIPNAIVPVSQEPPMHPYHDMYMQEFQQLHADNRRLH
ncbi:unnamed protein product [Lactuca saligna]|uniref:Uncharacterized protein n=1 Tax=Lactuca saligna TaxID=75948 RepID=A0AA35ZC88_LACSI|nr:unnamed protein product [Lactuca saligna]